jgi:hypothetical protein
MQKLMDAQTANIEGRVCLVTGGNSTIGSLEIQKSSAESFDEEVAKKLWEVSEEMTHLSATGANP